MINRNLDGIYFRIERNGKCQNSCFSDLTEGEQKEALKNKSPEFVLQVALNMAKRLREIGDQLGLEYN